MHEKKSEYFNISQTIIKRFANSQSVFYNQSAELIHRKEQLAMLESVFYTIFNVAVIVAVAIAVAVTNAKSGE